MVFLTMIEIRNVEIMDSADMFDDGKAKTGPGRGF
jgi:hypothetical protein